MSPELDDNRQFIETLRARFPEVADEIDFMGVEGLLYVEIGTFEEVSLRAWNSGNIDALLLYFAFVDDALDGADDNLVNALHVSYAEGFAWGSDREQEARRLMPPRLGAAFDSMLDHLRKLPQQSRSSRPTKPYG